MKKRFVYEYANYKINEFNELAQGTEFAEIKAHFKECAENACTIKAIYRHGLITENEAMLSLSNIGREVAL